MIKKSEKKPNKFQNGFSQWTESVCVWTQHPSADYGQERAETNPRPGHTAAGPVRGGREWNLQHSR